MYLVLGSFFAAAMAAEAFEASEPAAASFASSSTLSFDLIHSYDLMSIYMPITVIRTLLTISSTYQLRLCPRLAESANR